MEELSMLQSMFKVLNSNKPNKKAIIEALPILLNAYEVHGDFDVYNLVVTSTHNIFSQVFDSEHDNSIWTENDVLDNLKNLLIYFIDMISKHNSTDIVQLFQYFVKLLNTVDLKKCSNKKLSNIEFCMQKICISSISRNGEVEKCEHFNQLKSTLVNLLNEPFINKNTLDAVIMLLNNIMSVHFVPVLWQDLIPIVKMYPDRAINLLFNMQYLFFDPLCVSVVLNNDDFWDLLCRLLTCRNNVIRTYTNVVLKLACSQLSNEDIDCFPKECKEKCLKVWNDYVIVMETLENTQQHLTLPILSTAKKLASQKIDSDYCYDYVLPLKWITAMHCKMSKHNSKFVVLASIDIVTIMPMDLLKRNEQLLQSFVESLNNVFLYKMSSELCICQHELEIILTSWFDDLMLSNDGHEVFDLFLSYVPTTKWSTVPLIFLTKSLASISSNPSLGFNIVDHVLKIKSAVENTPNSYLRNIVLSFLFVFTSKFVGNVDTKFHYELFDCLTVYHNNSKSWNFINNTICQINDLDDLDRQLSQHINGQYKIKSTCVGLLFLFDISSDNSICMTKLNEMYCTAENVSGLLDFLECLLEVECHHGRNDSNFSKMLDKHIWTLTMLWVEKCLQNSTESSCDDPVLCSFLDKVLFSNRIVNTSGIMNSWLTKCNSLLIKCLGNYTILAIYSWIGKYATGYSTDGTLKDDWLSFTKYFINLGFFSLKSRDFYHSKKQGMHKIPQLDIINTFFQHSTVSIEQILGIFEWFVEKTVERYDEYWSLYFSTAKTIFNKFPIKTHSEKLVQFVENSWEFLVGCRVSCFPNTTKSFIEMAFDFSLLSEEKYITFVENKIVQNILTENYSDKFSVCFSLLLLNFFEVNQSYIFKIFELRTIMAEFFAKCILFSIDRYGALKIEWDTFEYVRTLGNFPLMDDIIVEGLPDDRYLRFQVIKYLYKLNSSTLWENVLNITIKTESLLRDRKYFHNSKAYRIKQRVIQVLLIVACEKQNELLIFNENIYKWLLTSLKEVSHIHSVAYQIIWLMVLLYNKCYSFSNLWDDFKNAQENPNYLCCFISIVYHLHRIQNDYQLEIETKKHLLPLCFSNGYKTRLYSQVTLCKLCVYDSGKLEWSLLHKTIEDVLAKNEQTKKYENPFNDFFYQELNMIKCLSLKNVCIEMPRLLNVVYEERFPIQWLREFSVTIIHNDKYDLSLCSVSSFIEKITASSPSNETIVIDNVQNAQRKYIPSQPHDEHINNSSLIVVASLIDKVTNLGGLARTCQVFGASTLVVDSLSCIEKREFTALSMTAEKHQCIIEVRIKNLKSFLQKKKNEGYQIVAAEQTVDSVKLHDFEFPFKCVLLLGNETSGIPHDLLSIMDTCVEIEQLGVVRSLNVHVAGSLFIWEYTKQHCLKTTNL